MKPSYEQLEQERNELAAQVERLSGALDVLICQAEQVDSWEQFPSQWINDAQSVANEHPPAALAALKAQWQADMLENVSVAIASHDWFHAQKTPVQVATALLEESNRIRQRAQVTGNE